MQTYYSKSWKSFEKWFVAFLILLLLTSMLISCNARPTNINGISFIELRGNPAIQSIAWSTTNEKEILVTTGAGMGPGPATAYILDIGTGHKEIIAKSQGGGSFLEAKWAPDGKNVIIRAWENTIGFEPPGWWLVNVDNKSIKFLFDDLPASWSPDGKTIASLKREQLNNAITDVILQLTDIGTKTRETIYTINGSGYVSGPIWSPGGRFLAFSYGDSRPGDLYIFNLQTQDINKITENTLNSALAWSPKGDIIAVERRDPDKFIITLHLITMDGKCDVEIPNLEYPTSPTWSPDGKKLGFIGVDGVYFLDVNKMLGKDIYQALCP